MEANFVAPLAASPVKPPDELLLDELLLEELLDELLLDELLLDELLLDEPPLDELLLDDEPLLDEPPQAASTVLSIPITSILRIILVAPHLALATGSVFWVSTSAAFLEDSPINDSKEIAALRP